MRRSLGSTFRALREKHAISLRQLESLAGPARETTRKIEAGILTPSVELTTRFLTALQEPLDAPTGVALLRRVREAHGEPTGELSPQKQKQLVETVVRLMLSRDPRRQNGAIIHATQMEAELEMARLGLVKQEDL